MVDYLRRPVAHEAFFKKYASKKFLKGEDIFTIAIHSAVLIQCSLNFDASMGEEKRLHLSR